MIDEIQVKDVALIREASLSPSPSLTVLTGETGAGKTALVSAVKLLVGERADSSYVREGAKNAEVRGRLFPSDPTADELVAVRKVSADGAVAPPSTEPWPACRSSRARWGLW